MDENISWLDRIGLIRPLRVRNFRYLWFGSILSYISGQLATIAMPWLVLKLTGDPLAMGLVFAVAGLPRAVLMMVGGVATDRFSSRTVMLWTNVLRCVFVFILATLVYLQVVEMWMVLVLAFLFGASDAFFWPASIAILPKMLKDEDLPAGNALQQGLGQISQMIGPVLGGFIIAAFADPDQYEIADLFGIAIVFYIDAIALAVSFIAIAMINMSVKPASDDLSIASALASLKAGLKATWDDTPIRMMALIFAFFSIFFRGPYLVGIPVLADARFVEGALSFGLIGSAFGVGALIGMVIAGSSRPPPEHRLGLLIIVDIMVLGGSFFAYALAQNIETMMLFSGVSGLTDGYMSVIIITFIQRRVTGDLLGRVMSVIMMFNMGLLPLSAAVAGALIRWSLEGVFLGAGAAMMLTTVFLLSQRNLRQLGLSKPAMH